MTRIRPVFCCIQYTSEKSVMTAFNSIHTIALDTINKQPQDLKRRGCWEDFNLTQNFQKSLDRFQQTKPRMKRRPIWSIYYLKKYFLESVSPKFAHFREKKNWMQKIMKDFVFCRRAYSILSKEVSHAKMRCLYLFSPNYFFHQCLKTVTWVQNFAKRKNFRKDLIDSKKTWFGLEKFVVNSLFCFVFSETASTLKVQTKCT